MKKVDVLVVGQGLAGSLLSYELIKAGQRVLVIDHAEQPNSSEIAAGLYNPITGRNSIKTWRADDLFPDLACYYGALENALKTSFHYPKPIYRPFASLEEQNDLEGRMSDHEFDEYILAITTKSKGIKQVIDPFGGIDINFTGSVDLAPMLHACRSWLKTQQSYMAGSIDPKHLSVGRNCVEYQQSISAGRVVFCDGVGFSVNHYFENLKFNPVKGEILDIKCDLPTNYILNRGVFILPRNGIFRVGSTYDRNDLTWSTTSKAVKEILEGLGKLYSGKVEVVGHKAGVRPATFDRKPFIGFHANWPEIGIFNGFGAKGISQVPFFAKMMVNHIVKGEKLIADVRLVR